MDILYESLAFGVDLIILAVSIKEYMNCKKLAFHIGKAPQLSIGKELIEFLGKQKDKKIPYVVIRGTVIANDIPICSNLSSSATGAIQLIKLSEHWVARNVFGSWYEQNKIIKITTNKIPFSLFNNGVQVEIVDALSAAILDMDVVYDNYEPASIGLIDFVCGHFSGIHQKGLQTTEEMLRIGSYITGIGELELENGTLRLQASPLGPLFLTTSTKSALIKKIYETKNAMLHKIILCSAISLILAGLITRKYYLKRKRQRDERTHQLRILEEMKELDIENLSRQQLISDRLCVVCLINQKQIIVLPCGHVCMCVSCSNKIHSHCPICRGIIASRSVAYLA